MTGRKSSVGGKSGAGGGVRDTRSLNDKAFQSAATEDVVRFLEEAGYHKVLPASAFPVGSTEFKAIFEFLIGFLIPGYEVPKKGFETAIPELLRKVGYPVQVSKSTFQTLGTKHSWPHVLGVLHYLAGRAARCLRRSATTPGRGGGEIEELVFPCVDEHGDLKLHILLLFCVRKFNHSKIPGFRTGASASDDHILFLHFVDCYGAFNRGQDEFPDELSQLQDRLERNHGINRGELRRQEQRRQECRAELAELQREPGRFEALAAEYKNLDHDLRKIKSHCQENRAYLEKKEGDLAAVNARLGQLAEQKEQIQVGEERENAEKGLGKTAFLFFRKVWPRLVPLRTSGAPAREGRQSGSSKSSACRTSADSSSCTATQTPPPRSAAGPRNSPGRSCRTAQTLSPRLIRAGCSSWSWGRRRPQHSGWLLPRRRRRCWRAGRRT